MYSSQNDIAFSTGVLEYNLTIFTHLAVADPKNFHQIHYSRIHEPYFCRLSFVVLVRILALHL